jgi:hypothetical protein
MKHINKIKYNSLRIKQKCWLWKWISGYDMHECEGKTIPNLVSREKLVQKLSFSL